MEAISTHERGTIIRHLAKNGRWEANRKGHAITIVRFQGRDDKNQVHYSIQLSPTLTVSDQAANVFNAVHSINREIAGDPRPPRRGRKPAELPYIPQAVQTRQAEWLPYKDAEL